MQECKTPLAGQRSGNGNGGNKWAHEVPRLKKWPPSPRMTDYLSYPEGFFLVLDPRPRHSCLTIPSATR